MKKEDKAEKCNCGCDCCKDGCQCSKDDCKCCAEGCKSRHSNMMKMHSSSGGAIYGFGFIGALVYLIGNSPDFNFFVMGLIKAIVWPAFLVFHAFKFLLG